MPAPAPTFGTQIDLNLQALAPACAISPAPARWQLFSLKDLLDALEKSATIDPHQIAMMRTTAGHLSQFLGRSVDRVLLNELPGLVPRFRDWLKQKFPKGNTARSYANYLLQISKATVALGWKRPSQEIPQEWRAIYDACRKKGCAGIVRHAIERGKRPQDLRDADLEEWAGGVVAKGRTPVWGSQAQYLFRHVVRDLGLAAQMPQLSHPKVSTYAVPISELPASLRDEFEQILSFKQAPVITGGRRRTKIGAMTAGNLRKIFRKLCGFAIRKGKQPTRLDDLLEEQLIASFIDWYTLERGRQGSSLRITLGSFYAAVRQFRNQDLPWFRALLDQVPKEPRSAIRDRKARKWVDYDLLLDIPEKMDAAAGKRKYSRKKMAMLKRNQLLEAFLVHLKWRNRNLREAKLAPRSKAGNIFKEEIAPFDTCKRPEWVEEALRSNPHEKFWQALFREHEHKTGIRTGRRIHIIIPRELVPLLEEYVQNHRPVLAAGSDTQTLFVSRQGKPLGIHRVGRVVGNLTQRYAGRRVTPHIHRDIYLHRYLHENRRDYLAASRDLWHSNLQTTLGIYGEMFDESCGAVASEEWLERRKKQQAGRTPNGLPTAQHSAHSRPGADATSESLFADLRVAVAQRIADHHAVKLLHARIDGLAAEVGKASYAKRYQEFIACLGEHVSKLVDFLPLLTSYVQLWCAASDPA